MERNVVQSWGVRARARRGAVFVWVTILLLVFIGVLGLAIDWGYAYYTAQKLQNGADAAAMAGARHVWYDDADARAQAITIAAANEAGGASIQLADNPSNDPAGDVIVGHYDDQTRTFTATLEEGERNAVAVNARRTSGSLNGSLPLFFGALFGVDDAQITRWAIAVAEVKPAAPGILLLKSAGMAFQHSGNGSVTVNGTIQINSPYKEALHHSGAGDIEATEFNVVGQVKESGSGGELIGDINEGADPIPDPYASLPVPNFLNDPQNYPVRSTSKYTRGDGGPWTLLPGRYIGGMDLGGKATYHLSPGVYIIEGGGLKISTDPSARVIMEQVMVYNCGTNGGTSNADQFYISGNSTVIWTPIVGGTYDQFGLFQHRDLADKKVQISGNGITEITCIIYAKSAEVQLSGNGPTKVLGGGFVAASMQISGDGDFTVGGDDQTEEGGQKVYLAE